MKKITYLAVFEPSKTGYGVYFPDLNGCISFGDTFEEAQKNAKEALELHIYGMEKDGDIIPEPSKNPTIYPETEKGYLTALVTIYPDLVKNEMDNKRIKTNVTLPSWLKDIAEQNEINYSRILEAALIDYLDIKNHNYKNIQKKRV